MVYLSRINEISTTQIKNDFKVIAFEANPELIEYNKIKFRDEIKNGQLVIIEGAIVDVKNEDNYKVKFYVNKDKSIWGTVCEDWDLRNEHLGTSSEVIEVNSVDFSEVLKEYGAPYYMKIDIEGADLICLKTLLAFNVKPDFISIESNKLSFKALKYEFELLRKLGYNYFKAVNQKKVNKQKLTVQSLDGKEFSPSFKWGSSGAFGEDLKGVWLNEKKTLLKYRYIFLKYKLFGDYGLLTSITSQIPIIRRLTRVGWYDTHAKRG